MNEIGHQAGLADEVLLELLDGGVLLADQLYRDDLLEVARPTLKCRVDNPHAALGNLVHHLVMDLVKNVFYRRHAAHKKAAMGCWQVCK